MPGGEIQLATRGAQDLTLWAIHKSHFSRVYIEDTL